MHTIEYNITQTDVKIYPIIHLSPKDVATNLGSHGVIWAPPNSGQEPTGLPRKNFNFEPWEGSEFLMIDV